MKLQIDTKEKTIKIAENAKLGELIKVLDKLLPKEWKEYTLESNCIVNWTYYPVYPWTWSQPWRIGDVTYTTHGESVGGSVTSSVYNIDVKN